MKDCTAFGMFCLSHVIRTRSDVSNYRLRAVDPTTQVCEDVCECCWKYVFGKHTRGRLAWLHAMIEIQDDLVAGLTLLAHADIMTERTSLGRSLRSKHNRPQIKYRMSTSSLNDSFKALYDVFNDLTLYFSPVYCSPVVCFVQMWAGRADIEQVWRMLACE